MRPHNRPATGATSCSPDNDGIASVGSRRDARDCQLAAAFWMSCYQVRSYSVLCDRSSGDAAQAP
eukprot:359586-Chlamydomonas_euryale.AAC.6